MADESRGLAISVNTTGEWLVPEALLENGCRLVLEVEGLRDGEISLTLLDDEGILELNRQYFGRDRPTDVIAFALHEPGDPVLGDVYLGFEQARRQADELGLSLDEELLRLAIHGVLHVLGRQHPETEDRFGSEMFREQEELLNRVLERGAG
jgi:probable rRNA maturation factor